MICELVTTKVITVIEFNKYQRLDKTGLNPAGVHNTYSGGYWNVFNYDKNLIEFLDNNNILYSVNEV